jgi:hypothetical protein
MPSGGRRFGKDRGTRQAAEPVPPPPNGLSSGQREAWLELAPQIEAAGTYNAARFTAFRLAVRALALVYESGTDVTPATLRGLIETASKMISRFGIDPVGVAQADAAPAAPKADELDEFDRPRARIRAAR